MKYRDQLAKEQLMDELRLVQDTANNYLAGDSSSLEILFKVAMQIEEISFKDELANVDYVFEQLMSALEDVVTKCDDVLDGPIFQGFEYGRMG
jgi:hypothetical protein